jgi:hypothetical protein
MGADFLVAGVEYPKGKRDELVRLLRIWTPESFPIDPALVAEAYANEEDDDEEPSPLQKDVNKLIQHLTEESRESDTMYLRHSEVLLTGGMSWGNSPTDFFQVLEHLWMVGVLAWVVDQLWGENA